MKKAGWIAFLLVLVLLAGCSLKPQDGKNGKTNPGQISDSGQSDDGNDSDKTGENNVPANGQTADEPGNGTENTDQNGQAGNGQTGTGQTGAEAPSHVPATLDPDKVVYAEEEVYATTRVNIRTEPSTDSAVFRVAASREIFTRTASDGTWSAVEIDGKEYYISAKYLAPASELPSQTTTTRPANPGSNGYLVVIDAGHQAKGNSAKEPIGPGASERKAKVASGTTGVSTGLPEYKLTLAVSLKLRDELEARGYQVMMIRESHDVNISNAERAQIANDAGADAFIRVHANGSDDHSQNGILTICQTSGNPYNGNLYSESRSLSDCVVDAMVKATGAKKRSVWETDTMSGVNWCQVPVTIVEMGFMSNPAEDEKMATEDYQYQLAKGMADGIDAYFRRG